MNVTKTMDVCGNCKNYKNAGIDKDVNENLELQEWCLKHNSPVFGNQNCNEWESAFVPPYSEIHDGNDSIIGMNQIERTMNVLCGRGYVLKDGYNFELFEKEYGLTPVEFEKLLTSMIAVGFCIPDKLSEDITKPCCASLKNYKELFLDIRSEIEKLSEEYGFDYTSKSEIAKSVEKFQELIFGNNK
jgi:hypothetical protein